MTRPLLALASIVLLAGCAGSGSETNAEQDCMIAFTVNRSGWGEIWVMNSQGRNRIRLTGQRQCPCCDATPAWSPDGTRIAFAHLPGVGAENADGVIVVTNVDGRDRTELTRHPRNPASSTTRTRRGPRTGT